MGQARFKRLQAHQITWRAKLGGPAQLRELVPPYAYDSLAKMDAERYEILDTIATGRVCHG